MKSILSSLLLGLSMAFAAGGAIAKDVELLNVSYDPTRELYQDVNQAFAAKWKQQTGEDVTDPRLARRIRQAGALGDRRPRSRRRDAGAGRGHRRHRREGQAAAGELAVAPAEQQRALHLDDRVAGAQGQSEGHQGLGRSRQAGRRGDHAQPEDVRRRALELPRRVGLGVAAVPRRRRRCSTTWAGCSRTCRCSTPARAAPPRPSSNAASATCCRVGKRSVADARRTGHSRQVRDRGAERQHPRGAAGGMGRQERRPPWHAQAGRGVPALPVLRRKASDWRRSTSSARPIRTRCRPPSSRASRR